MYFPLVSLCQVDGRDEGVGGGGHYKCCDNPFVNCGDIAENEGAKIASFPPPRVRVSREVRRVATPNVHGLNSGYVVEKLHSLLADMLFNSSTFQHRFANDS